MYRGLFMFTKNQQNQINEFFYRGELFLKITES